MLVGTSELRDPPASQRPRLRSKLWGIGLVAPAVVLAAFLGVRTVQRLWPHAFFSPTPQTVGLSGFADVTVPTEDGQRLDAWWSPPPRPGGGVVLFLHGTPATLPNTAPRLASLRRGGLGALAIDYRGYGRSTGEPSERGLRIDARSAFDYLRRVAPRSPIAVFGESLGTYPAVAVACERPVAGVLLNSPFASLRSLWALRGTPSERWLVVAPFNTAALVGHIRAPLMVLEGTDDQAVPLGEALAVYAVARAPKTMIVVPGAGHIQAYQGAAEAEALAALTRWTGGADGGR